MKLKYLTLVEMASEKKILRFEALKRNLGLKDANEIEDLLCNAMDLDILNGRINCKEGIFRVNNY